MPIAANPDTGEVVALGPDGQWMPAKVAVNPTTQEKLAFDGKDWVPVAAGAKKPDVNVVEDAVKGGGIGVAHGLIDMAMLPGNVRELGARGLNWAGTKLGLAEPRENMPLPSEAMQKLIEKQTGEFYEPKTAAGRYAKTGGEFLAGGAITPVNTARRLMGMVVAPAIGSQTAAELPGVEGSKYEGIARLLGAGAGMGAAGIGRAVSAPIVSNVRARMDPAGYAGGQVGRMVADSRATPQEIARALEQATTEGQPMFTVADAMGNAGQRGLSTVARSPGQGRTDVVEFLEGRQAGQGQRVSNALAEGFDAPQTATQTRERLTNARDTAADANYRAVRNDADPVDLTATIARIDDILSPGATRIMRPASNIADDSVESALRSVRDRLTDDRSVLSDFTAIQRVRGDLSDKIEAARRAGQGNKARLLTQALREMDTAMENASAGHRATNQQFSTASRAIDAIDEGRTAAQRGRPEDVVRDFRSRPINQQESFRTGYVDPLIEQVQGAPVGVNKARQFTSDAFRNEAAALSPQARGPVMDRRLGRENTMFETRRQALGGSQTADNLADAAAAGLNPSVVVDAIMRPHGVIKNILAASSNVLSGNTPAVRAEIARILLMRGENATPAAVHDTLTELRHREIARRLNRRIGYAVPAGTALIQGPSNAP